MNKIFVLLVMTLLLTSCTYEPSVMPLDDSATAQTVTTDEDFGENHEFAYIVTSEYYSDLLTDEQVKLLKENIVTIDVLNQVLGKIMSYDRSVNSETYTYGGKSVGDYYYSEMDYSCKDYDEFAIVSTGFYSKETHEYIRYIYKCVVKNESGEPVTLFYKRIAPPSNINFEGLSKPARELPSENLSEYFTEEEIEFLKNNFITIDTLEQVLGPVTHVDLVDDGNGDPTYFNDRLGDPYQNMIRINWNKKEVLPDLFVYDIETITISEGNGLIFLNLP